MQNIKLEIILAGCARNDRKYQKALYKKYYGFCMAICLRYGGNRYDAAEIMNEGFYKVFTKIDLYNQDKPFQAWIGRIMTNTAINYYRSNLRLKHTENLEKAEEYSGQYLADSQMQYQELLSMIQELPPAYRTVFNMYVIEGYGHSEIGEIINISEATSRSHLFKAREKLKRWITEAERRLQNMSNVSAGDSRLAGSFPIRFNHLASCQ